MAVTPWQAVIDINMDPVLRIGGLGVHWYGLMYAAAFGVGLYLGVIPHLERRGIDRQTAERFTVWTIVFGLLGARLYYVVQSSPPQGGSWFSHPVEILAVWHGGMAFFGAIIAAPITFAVLCWREKHNWWLVADACAVFGVLGQPIGRIGNVVNGDILGHESTLPWAVTYSHPDAILQSGFSNCSFSKQVGDACIAYQPAAVYEALGTLVILGVLFTLRARWNPAAGFLWIAYLELYAISQLLIFFARGSEPTVGLGLKQAQWTAIVVGAVVVPLLVAAWRRGVLNWAAAGVETGAITLPPPAVETAAPAEPGVVAAAPTTTAPDDVEAAPADAADSPAVAGAPADMPPAPQEVPASPQLVPAAAPEMPAAPPVPAAPRVAAAPPATAAAPAPVAAAGSDVPAPAVPPKVAAARGDAPAAPAPPEVPAAGGDGPTPPAPPEVPAAGGDVPAPDELAGVIPGSVAERAALRRIEQRRERAALTRRLRIAAASGAAKAAASVIGPAMEPAEPPPVDGGAPPATPPVAAPGVDSTAPHQTAAPAPTHDEGDQAPPAAARTTGRRPRGPRAPRP